MNAKLSMLLLLVLPNCTPAGTADKNKDDATLKYNSKTDDPSDPGCLTNCTVAGPDTNDGYIAEMDQVKFMREGGVVTLRVRTVAITTTGSVNDIRGHGYIVLGTDFKNTDFTFEVSGERTIEKQAIVGENVIPQVSEDGTLSFPFTTTGIPESHFLVVELNFFGDVAVRDTVVVGTDNLTKTRLVFSRIPDDGAEYAASAVPAAEPTSACGIDAIAGLSALIDPSTWTFGQHRVPVDSFTDGTGKLFSQANTAKRPRFVKDGPGGFPAIASMNFGDHMTYATSEVGPFIFEETTLQGSTSIMAVVKMDENAEIGGADPLADRRILFGGQCLDDHVLSVELPQRKPRFAKHSVEFSEASSTLPADRYSLLTITYSASGSETKFFADGVNIGAASQYIGYSQIDPTYLFGPAAGNCTNGNNDGFAGRLAFLAVFKKTMLDGDRIAAEQCLKTRFGL